MSVTKEEQIRINETLERLFGSEDIGEAKGCHTAGV